jgi:transcriptional regulator with XRE-family HTH domain
MKKQAYNLSLTQILSHLMYEKGLKECDLVASSGIPQTTISSILRGKSKNPRKDTLKSIAALFDMNLEQLLSYKSSAIANSNTCEDFMKSNVSSLPPSRIPLIEWVEVKPWILGQSAVKPYTDWISNDSCKSLKAFALKIKPSMYPHFFSSKQIGGGISTAILLVDPIEAQTFIKDGLIILVFLDKSNEPFLRLSIVEGEKKRLQPLERGRPSIALNSKHSVVGSVVEVRFKPSTL